MTSSESNEPVNTVLSSARRKPHMDVPQRAMMYAARGQDVQDLQVLLRDAGVYPHDLDGYFGNYTRVAVSLLQERFGCFGNGHWDEPTIAAINALVGDDGCVDSQLLCGSKPF